MATRGGPTRGGSGRRSSVTPPPVLVIGRAREMARLRAELDAGERLISLVGPPGTGKTTLARRFASDESTSGRRDAWLCDLTETRDADEIRAAVGRTLGIHVGVGDADASAQIEDALARHEGALVVLDNFEQVVVHGPETVGRWIDRAPSAHFLVTSRERLRLPSEVVIALEPLATPTEDEPDVDVILASDAVAMLVDRARRVRSDFSPRSSDVATLRDIVRELDGIPLAIELAAARLGVLGPRELLARLSRRLDVLAGGARDAVRRHATMRAAIAWSWTMLDARERSALAQCAVFRGGWTLEAAEAVIVPSERLDGSEDDGSEPSAVLDVIAALHDKSLVRSYDVAIGSGATSERRMGLFASIAEYAGAELASSTIAERVRSRHASWVTAAGRAWATEVDGPEGTDRLRRLAIEQDNLTAVVERGLATAATREALDLAIDALLALDPLRTAQGPIDAHLAWLDRAITRAEEMPPTDAADHERRALAYDARARAGLFRGRNVDARDDATRAVSSAERAGGDRVLGRVLASAATMMRQRGEMDDALATYERSIAALARAGDGAGRGAALGGLAILHKECGRLAEARRGYESAITLLAAVGDRRAEARFRCDLGALHQEQRRFEDARACFVAALSMHREMENRRFEAIALSDLGALAFETGALRDAESSLRSAVAILRDIGDRRYEALFTGALGAVQACLGSIDEACESIARAEAFLAREGDAVLLARQGDATFLGAVQVHAGHLDHAIAKRAASSGDHTGAARHRDAARARIERVYADGPDGAPSLASLSDDVRFAVRVLDAALSEDAGATGDDALAVGPDARWFRPPGATERVDLGKRDVARRLLLALTEHRVAHAGRALGLDALRDHGWPNERVLSEAAANRIQVALSTLRALGLRSLLLRRDDGYLLDPDVPLIRAS